MLKVQVFPPPEIHGDGFWALVERLFAHSLFQSVVVLLLTALITGIGVPRIKARMDMDAFAEQKAHEARLARQAQIITERRDNLAAFIDVCWQFHTAMAQVTYAKVTQIPPSEFDALWAAYGPLSWDYLARLRKVISGAIYLVSPEHYRQLLAFHDDLTGEDEALSVAVKADAKQSGPTVAKTRKVNWIKEHVNYHSAIAKRIDAEIAALAAQYDLAPLQVKPA